MSRGPGRIQRGVLNVLDSLPESEPWPPSITLKGLASRVYGLAEGEPSRAQAEAVRRACIGLPVETFRVPFEVERKTMVSARTGHEFWRHHMTQYVGVVRRAPSAAEKVLLTAYEEWDVRPRDSFDEAAFEWDKCGVTVLHTTRVEYGLGRSAARDFASALRSYCTAPGTRMPGPDVFDRLNAFANEEVLTITEAIAAIRERQTVT
ncbi:hypothetical protein [Streptomyces decoyicus]|uniref:hypothetical protein n=1 Tax=Streptomyces decoyicus TaxID=249567 RepID=UPI00386C3745